MGVITPVAPSVRRSVPFVSNKDEGDKDAGHKDVGQKDGAPQAPPCGYSRLSPARRLRTRCHVAVQWSRHRRMPRRTRRGRPITTGEPS